MKETIKIYKPKCPICGQKSLVFRDIDQVYKCEVCGSLIDLDKMPNWR